jgi:hypothetical protein
MKYLNAFISQKDGKLYVCEDFSYAKTIEQGKEDADKWNRKATDSQFYYYLSAEKVTDPEEMKLMDVDSLSTESLLARLNVKPTWLKGEDS